MSSTDLPTTLVLNRPRKQGHRGGFGRALLLTAGLITMIGAGLWAAGFQPKFPWSGQEQVLRSISIRRGDLRVFVLESGTLESSDNATVKCQVEALMGTIGGTQAGATGAMGGRAATTSSAAQPVATAATKGATATTKGATGAAGASGMASGGGGGGGGAAMAKPIIKSFTMQVQPHVPLRPRTGAAGTAKNAGQNGMAMGQGGRGGGGGGGGGGGNRGGTPDMGGEKPGSTKILRIVPEGERVKAGDIVCELDASAFKDELQSQLIRWAQAQAWVDQAKQILAVSHISLREYRDGIYPQDLQQLNKYIEVCRIQLKQADDSVKWSREMVAQSFQTPSQLRAAELGEQQMRIALIEAEGMKRRLVDYTAPRLLNNLEAKIASVQADLLAQESTFQLEDDRKRRIERMIENCTLRAPRDGMIAYAATTNGNMWNPTVTPIQEGVVVRQGQSILMVPDPTKMRVKVRVNESKVSHVFVGQKAAIRVEAFADHALTGTVTELTAIPAPSASFMSDVKLYYANVEIDKGFEGLRTGLSAEVAFFVAEKPDVVRIPLESIRWSGGEPFAAIPRKTGKGFDWRSLRLGLVGTADAEVVEGLAAGDSVVAHPDELPSPPAPPLRARAPLALEAAVPKAG